MKMGTNCTLFDIKLDCGDRTVRDVILQEVVRNSSQAGRIPVGVAEPVEDRGLCSLFISALHNGND